MYSKECQKFESILLEIRRLPLIATFDLYMDSFVKDVNRPISLGMVDPFGIPSNDVTLLHLRITGCLINLHAIIISSDSAALRIRGVRGVPILTHRMDMMKDRLMIIVMTFNFYFSLFLKCEPLLTEQRASPFCTIFSYYIHLHDQDSNSEY